MLILSALHGAQVGVVLSEFSVHLIRLQLFCIIMSSASSGQNLLRLCSDSDPDSSAGLRDRCLMVRIRCDWSVSMLSSLRECDLGFVKVRSACALILTPIALYDPDLGVVRSEFAVLVQGL